MTKNKLYQLFWEKSDIICAVASLVIMLVSLAALEVKGFHPLYSISVVFGMVCVAGYLLFRNKTTNNLDPDMDTSPQEEPKYLYFRRLLGISIVILVVAILEFFSRSNSYVKPLPYYTLMALSSGVLFLAATKIRNNFQFGAVLIVACTIGLTHIWTENAMFPNSLIGIDPWHHSHVVTDELATGNTEVPIGITTVGTAYSLMHLYLRFIMDIFPIGYKMASLIFAGSVLVVGNITLSGLIGKELFNRKVGAVAAVVLATANWGIFFGEWVIPNSIGATLSLLAAYLLLMKRRPVWMKDWVLVLLILAILGAAYFTHFIAAVWVVATVACLLSIKLVLAIRNIIKKEATVSKVKSLATIVLLAALVISIPVWLSCTTAGNSIERSTDGYSFNPSFGPTTTVGVVPVTAADNGSTVIQNATKESRSSHLGELTVDSAGMILYFGIALVGTLIVFKNRKRADRWLWVLLGVGILSVGFFPPLFGKSLLEYRWWYFAEVLLSVPLAIALLTMVKGKISMIVTVLVVSSIAFLSTIGLPSNLTNRELSPSLIVRYAFTDTELEGLDQIRLIDGEDTPYIGADPLYRNLIMSNTYYTGIVDSLEKSLVSGDFTEVRADTIVLRNALCEEPFGFGSGTIYQLDSGIIDAARSQGYTEVWDNGEVYLLTRSKQ